MNDDLYKKLVLSAGFLVWENETWKPTNSFIDWGCDYDGEMKKYTELLVEYCCDVMLKNKDTNVVAAVRLLRQELGF